MWHVCQSRLMCVNCYYRNNILLDTVHYYNSWNNYFMIQRENGTDRYFQLLYTGIKQKKQAGKVKKWSRKRKLSKNKARSRWNQDCSEELRARHRGCAQNVSDYAANVTLISIHVCRICSERENCWIFNRLLRHQVFLNFAQENPLESFKIKSLWRHWS